MNLSHDLKESIKTALAMTLAYGIGLQMGWDRPYWAGFAVAFISLSTEGQSFNKAALRMAGTVVAAVVALTLIGLFAQQRWMFILFLSLWFGLCTYMNAGPRHQYFWFVAGFVSLIIAVDGGPNADNAFTIAMLRLQQTGLGILVYSLVALLLWPNNSQNSLRATAKSLASTQHKLFSASMQLLANEEQPAVVKTARAEEITGLTQLAPLLDAAATDSEEIRALQNQWRRYQQTSGEFAQTMERWRENFSELRSLPLPQVLPGLDAFALELQQRLDAIYRMLDGVRPAKPCTGVELSLDTTAARELSHFHRAAVLVAQHRMQQIEALSRDMFDSCSAMLGYSNAVDNVPVRASQPGPWVPDPDRLLAAGKMMAVLWIAFLAVVYIGDFPGGLGFLGMCGPIGLNIVTNPQMPLKFLFPPVTVAILFAAALYIFVMPQLSSFTGLGVMIFLATFLICYRNASPQRGLGRSVGLAVFVVIMSVSNQQSYSFLSVATTALMFPLLFLLLAIVAYIPYSPRPERALLRLLTRYFRSAEFLLSQTAHGDNTALASHRQAFHQQELASLPGKMSAWAAHADPTVLGATSAQQLPALVSSLQTLSYHLQELQAVRSLPQSPLLVAAVADNILDWRARVVTTLQSLATDPAYGKTLAPASLHKQISDLESSIRQCLDGVSGDELSSTDQQNFYQLLGAYRGTSQALLDFAAQAASVDWAPWYKERFA